MASDLSPVRASVGGYRSGTDTWQPYALSMTTFVLVPGAWIGAWAWRDVAADLRARGHLVYPLSLTGLAERVHLGRPETNLDTHIEDVLNLFEFEDLGEVVLVGHSYAGGVITGVADRAADRLQALVYCDTFPLANGQAQIDMMPAEAQAATRKNVEERGDGWRLPFPGIQQLRQDASLTGLDDAMLARMQAKAVGHPFASWTQPLLLHHADDAPTYERVAIACEEGQQYLPMLEQMLPGARVLTMDTGHWPMLS